jgi:hypothetical protein
VSPTCDIYSLGVVILELLISRRTNDPAHDPAVLVMAFEDAVEDNAVHALADALSGWPRDAATELAGLATMPPITRCAATDNLRAVH